MMKNQNYFVFAVMIAIIVPVTIGSIYFINMYKKRGSGVYISNLITENEILILGDLELDNLTNKKEQVHSLDLVVKYTYGVSEVQNYNIYLDEVFLKPGISLKKIKWDLLMLDEDDNKYLQLDFGDFDELVNGKLSISPNIQIGKGHTQRFKLNYYYNSEDEIFNRTDFYAKVILE